ncbi:MULTISPECIES: hypothetical protein [Alishewanella]|uniref:Uncharacterized protein n=1 Tax=Alishewanella aestuarii B11 TaxID=1197174 RepID=J1QN41_9ALTE|nr:MULTISPECIES: hypothetical protein [Alishewanella]EJI87031.1 hypothetical protein AEST_00720 [Alishewanella aestuarii B11]OCW97039.1 hypothetical protein A9165_08520 [Alishewanella sp. HH-ZS]
MREDKKISLDEYGDIKINDEVLNEIAGGVNPEDLDDDEASNRGCVEVNKGCVIIKKEASEVQ